MLGLPGADRPTPCNVFGHECVNFGVEHFDWCTISAQNDIRWAYFCVSKLGTVLILKLPEKNGLVGNRLGAADEQYLVPMALEAGPIPGGLLLS